MKRFAFFSGLKAGSGLEAGFERTAWILLIVLALFNIARGLFHAFAPDGGAGTIAHLDLSTNAQNIIYLIAIIGIHQIAIGLFQLLIAFRARQFLVHAYVIDAAMLLIPQLLNKSANTTFPGLTAHHIELIIVLVMLIAFVVIKGHRRS